MDIKVALTNINSVLREFRGTAQDHELLKASFDLVVSVCMENYKEAPAVVQEAQVVTQEEPTAE